MAGVVQGRTTQRPCMASHCMPMLQSVSLLHGRMHAVLASDPPDAHMVPVGHTLFASQATHSPPGREAKHPEFGPTFMQSSLVRHCTGPRLPGPPPFPPLPEVEPEPPDVLAEVEEAPE